MSQVSLHQLLGHDKLVPVGTRLLGRGSFSAVYEPPTRHNRVLKVGCDPATALYLQADIGGRHVPRVYRRFCLDHTARDLPVFVYEMERLAPARRSVLPWSLTRLNKGVEQTQWELRRESDERWATLWIAILAEAATKAPTRSVRHYLMGLSSFLASLTRTHPDLDVVCDGFTRRNVGARADGTPVFFDPVFSQTALWRL